jgi:pyruvate, water dikinase
VGTFIPFEFWKCAMATRYVRWFAELGLTDVGLVGGKNASLGELHRTLTAAAIPVANGFAVTADAYRAMLDANGLREKLREVLAGSEADGEVLVRAAKACRELVYRAPLPHGLEDEIVEAHGRLEAQYGPELTVAVRSSATAEDLPEASFAGQHDSFLNVTAAGRPARCGAALFGQPVQGPRGAATASTTASTTSRWRCRLG